jgi:hypothetical protein
MANPITNVPSLEHKSLGSINSRLLTLGKVQDCLFNIENTLNIVETSVAADNYLNILEIGVIYDRGSTAFSVGKEFSVRPTELLELVNYVRCISAPGSKLWQVDKFSDNFSFLLNNISLKFETKAVEKNESGDVDHDSDVFVPKNINFAIESFRKFEQFLEGYSILCMNHHLFYGGLSLIQNIIQEQVINDAPPSVVFESSLLRYLVESNLDKAIQECYYLLSVGSSQVPTSNGMR